MQTRPMINIAYTVLYQGFPMSGKGCGLDCGTPWTFLLPFFILSRLFIFTAAGVTVVMRPLNVSPYYRVLILLFFFCPAHFGKKIYMC